MYLGIDVGTTATKAILIGGDQQTIATAGASYPVVPQGPGISEADPRAWVDALRTVVGQLRATAPAALSATRAVGLSGQMHSLVTLDAADRPLRPALLWSDARGEEEALSLRQALPDIGQVTGVLPMPSFTAPKLLWLRRHRPEEFAGIRGILWPKDFVRLWLTGERATDVSEAAGSQLLDQRRRRWAGPVLEHLGVDPAWLPRLLEGTESSGRLRPAVAGELGLPAGIPVAAGGGDSATGAVGLGCIDQGRAFISLGTGSVFVAAQGAYHPLPERLLHTFAHCVPDRWYRMAAMLNGASCLAWVARLCNEPDLEALLARVEARGAGPGRVLFQPYLRGERTPHNDVQARGAFVGLDADCDAVDLARAVLEGVAFVLRLAQEVLTDGEEALSSVGLVGGGARSAHWARLIATVLGRPLDVLPDADCVPALGAARLAMVAGGAASLAEAAVPPADPRRVEPDPAQAAAFAARYQDFRALYPALRPFTRRTVPR
jgi:xylulokinase